MFYLIFIASWDEYNSCACLCMVANMLLGFPFICICNVFTLTSLHFVLFIYIVVLYCIFWWLLWQSSCWPILYVLFICIDYYYILCIHIVVNLWYGLRGACITFRHLCFDAPFVYARLSFFVSSQDNTIIHSCSKSSLTLSSFAGFAEGRCQIWIFMFFLSVLNCVDF